MVVYLAGAITGVDGYKEIFRLWEKRLIASGYTVLNPAHLPFGMPKRAYMPICMAMLEQADVLALIPGWEESKGVQLEIEYATYQGKEIRCL